MIFPGTNNSLSLIFISLSLSIYIYIPNPSPLYNHMPSFYFTYDMAMGHVNSYTP